MTAVTLEIPGPAESRPMHTDRIRTSIPVEFRSSGRVAEGTVLNASDGGMFVEARAIPPQGESISLRFTRGSERALVVRGLVWWTTEATPFRHRRRGFGIRLLEDDARYSALVEGLRAPARSLARLRAVAAAELRGSGKSPRSR